MSCWPRLARPSLRRARLPLPGPVLLPLLAPLPLPGPVLLPGLGLGLGPRLVSASTRIRMRLPRGWRTLAPCAVPPRVKNQGIG